MELVQPIRSKEKIAEMKNALNEGRDQLFFIFGVFSGLRVSDIIPLKVGDVRGKTGVSLTEKKTRKGKVIPFNKAIIEAIAQHVPADASNDDYLFPSRKGGHITRQQAWNILKKAADAAGIENLGVHGLRKTFGYHAYQSGVDLPLLMSIFNHSSQAVTLRYIGILQEDITEVYHTLDLGI